MHITISTKREDKIFHEKSELPVTLSLDHPVNILIIILAIFSFRRDNLMQVTTAAGVEAVLADLSSLPVIPLIMLALERGKTG